MDGTPLESTIYKFAKCLRNRFGVIKGITDKEYITNFYHLNVKEEIDAFKKLGFEAQFQKISSGDAVSYVEVTNLNSTIEAYQGTNFDTKIASHFGDCFCICPEKTDITGFSVLLAILGAKLKGRANSIFLLPCPLAEPCGNEA